MKPDNHGRTLVLKITLFPMLIFLFIVFSLKDLQAFRCGQELVTVGDRKVEIESKCGEPFSREIIGYTLTADQEREFKLTEWAYKTDRDQFYILTFEGSTLIKIEFIRK